MGTAVLDKNEILSRIKKTGSLVGENLSGIDLEGVDLSGVDLSVRS